MQRTSITSDSRPGNLPTLLVNMLYWRMQVNELLANLTRRTQRRLVSCDCYDCPVICAGVPIEDASTQSDDVLTLKTQLCIPEAFYSPLGASALDLPQAKVVSLRAAVAAAQSTLSEAAAVTARAQASAGGQRRISTSGSWGSQADTAILL